MPDAAAACAGEQAMSELLAGVDVAEVYLYHRDVQGRQRIGQGHRGVRVAARVDEHALEAFLRGGLQPVDELPLHVALAVVQLMLREARPKGGHEGVEGFAAVDLRLAGAHEIQVGAVEDKDLHRRVSWPSPRGT